MTRPSSLKYIEICSDFEQPEQTEVHPVTEAGSRLHYAMETGDLKDVDPEEMWMYERAKTARADLMTEVFGDLEPTVHKELKLEVAGNYAGMVDHFALAENVGLLIDYKFGFHKVDDPDVNIQFQDYTVKLFDRFKEVDTIVVSMIAPRRDEVTKHTYERSDVQKLRTRCKMVRERAGTGQRKASNNCQYCSHLGTCQEAYNHFAATKHQSDMLPVVKPTWDLSKPMDLKQALDVRPILKKFVADWDKAVGEAAKELLGQGIEVEGYYLQSRAGRKSVTNPWAVREHALGEGLRPEDWDKCVSVSLTTLKNLITDTAPRGGKKAKWEHFEDVCAPHIEQAPPTEVVAKRK